MARYALVIGIAKYFPPYEDLENSTNDAEKVAQLLEQHGQFEVERLPKHLNQETGHDEVAKEELTGYELGQALRQFLEKAKGSDALIYYSGHGITVENHLRQLKGYLVTSDCESGTVWKDGIALDGFNDLIRQADVSSLVVILDCCHAGYFLESNLIRQTLSVFSSKTDCFLIAACRSAEKAYEGGPYGGEHSVFTNALLEGLSQENAGDDGKIKTDEVFVSILRKLDLRKKTIPHKPQEAIRISSGRSLTLVSYPPKPTPPPSDETCPYQGLQPFDKKQARFFFGRRQVVEMLRQKLEQGNFVSVIGASGSGKSSVVRAGLSPGLEESGWRVLEPILPGSEPLEKLKQAFTQLVHQAEQIQAIASLIDSAADLQQVIERLPGSERLLLVVDQFEEVFTVCPKEKEEERRRFIQLLTKVAEIPASRLAIVATMRADFLEPCLQYPSLTQLIQTQAVYMPPLVGADLEKAITQPAKLQGYGFEEGLLGEILQDVGKEQGCLPLLQFALTELWEKRDRQKHQLTVAQYRAMGGVIGALDRHAELIYSKQEATKQERETWEKEWIKRLFLKLVRTGEEVKDTRQRQPKAKLLAIAADNSQDRQAISDVLDELIRGRLLVTGQENRQEEAWVDLAHEALMEGWQRFAQWRQENRPLRRLSDRVEDALREWQKEPKDENLMMGGLLDRVQEKWLELEPDLDAAAREFYLRSHSYKQQQNAAIVRARDEGVLQEQAARVLKLISTEPLEGLLLAIQATSQSLMKFSGEVPNTVQISLRKAVEVAREQNVFLYGKDSIGSVVFSPNGQYIASSNGGRRYSFNNNAGIWLHDRKGNFVCEPFGDPQDYDVAVIFSPNSQYIISCSIREAEAIVDYADITFTGRGVRLWDCQGNPVAGPFQVSREVVKSLAASPDGQCIVSGRLDGNVCLWGYQGQLIGGPFRFHEKRVKSLTFSSDSQHIISIGQDKDDITIRLWDCRGNFIHELFRERQEVCAAVAFSPENQCIVSGSQDGTIQLWDSQGNLIGDPFQGHHGKVKSIAFSPDGQRIVSHGDDGNGDAVRLWDLQGKQIVDPFRYEHEIVDVAFSPDGQCIAIICYFNFRTELRLWDVRPLPGDNWETLLQVACDRLRYHPIFKNPQTEEAKAACETCQKYIWSKTDSVY